MSKGFYLAGRELLRVVLGIFSPTWQEGAKNVPAEGPVILCANHESLTDPLHMALCVSRPICFMAKKELFDVPLFGRIVKGLDAFPVDRDARDLSAVRKSLALLKEGKILGIFPQGKRRFKGGAEFLTGTSLIALRSGAPVIPVLIEGRSRLFRRTRLHFGPPVDLSDFQGAQNAQTLAAATERIEAAVYALRPGEKC